MMKSKSKEEILEGKMDMSVWFGDHVMVMGEECAKQAMTEHAQSLAKEVVEEIQTGISKGNDIVSKSHDNALSYAIELIKAKFQL